MKVLIASDIHYACPAEQARQGFAFHGIPKGIAYFLLKVYRDYVWLRDPCFHNDLLDQFLATPIEPDFVVINGDLSTDTAFVGVSDDSTLETGKEVLRKIHARFGKEKVRVTLGDHELGKVSMVSKLGGMRSKSLYRAKEDLGLKPFWTQEIGRFIMVGVTSSLLALPIYQHDVLPEEMEAWQKHRKEHLEKLREFFRTLPRDKKFLLFCHDPTALPFLWKESGIQERISQLDTTIIGHLHSNLFLWKSRLLAGMPIINFLGPTARRMSSALNDAKYWKPFKIRLCPALAGIELLKDGGYYVANLDGEQAQFRFYKIKR